MAAAVEPRSGGTAPIESLCARMAYPDWWREHRAACLEQAAQIGSQRTNQTPAVASGCQPMLRRDGPATNVRERAFPDVLSSRPLREGMRLCGPRPQGRAPPRPVCARLRGWPSASAFGPAEAAMPAVRVPMTARNEALAVTAARVSLRRFLVVRANVNRFRSLTSPSGVRNSALGHQGGPFDAEPDQRAI